jgi:hypothetical protein
MHRSRREMKKGLSRIDQDPFSCHRPAYVETCRPLCHDTIRKRYRPLSSTRPSIRRPASTTTNPMAMMSFATSRRAGARSSSAKAARRWADASARNSACRRRAASSSAWMCIAFPPFVMNDAAQQIEKASAVRRPRIGRDQRGIRALSTNKTIFSARRARTAEACEAHDDRRKHGNAVHSVAVKPLRRLQHNFHVSLRGDSNLSYPIMRITQKSTRAVSP